MRKKQASISDFFKGVPLSEPLKTFKGNVVAIAYIAGETVKTIDTSKGKIQELHDKVIQEQKEDKESLQRDKKELEKLRELRTKIRAIRKSPTAAKDVFQKDEHWLNEAIEDWQRIVIRSQRIHSKGDFIIRQGRALLNMYEKASEILMPMVFVFLVTIWDAFVLDTVRRILRVHPELITLSDEEIKLNTSFLWNMKSTKDIRNYMIENKVRYLDGHRDELLKCFREHWGIDWEKSGVALSDTIEIRARRDIWVHNKGIVNKQYRNMVGEDTSLKEGQVAQVDIKYLNISLAKLTHLTVYIHNIAHKKHYAKVNIG